MIFHKKTRFYKHILLLGFCVIFLECISAFTSRSTITYQNQFPFFIKQQLSLRRFRPLLADDAKTKVKSYDKYFQKWTTLKIEDIKLLYQNILTANSKSVKDEMMQITKQATLFDLIWKMLRQNSDLQMASFKENSENEKSSLLDHFSRIRAHIGVGSFMEIGGCEVSTHIAALSKDKTVIAILQDEKQAMQCSDRVSSQGLENLYLSKVSPEMLQQVIEDISSDSKVLFGSIFLKDFLILSTSLLPHEFEQMLARVFSLSLHTFIPNVNINNNSKYFSITKMWSSPRELFLKACRIADLTCSVDMLWGHNTWNFPRSIYKVTVKKGFRLVNPELCKAIGEQSECFAEFGTNNSRITIRFGNGNHYTSPIDLNQVPLTVFLKTGPVQEIYEELFVKLLYAPHEEIKQDELLLVGSEIKTKQVPEQHVTQVIQTSKPDAIRKKLTLKVQEQPQVRQEQSASPVLSNIDSRTDFLLKRQNFHNITTGFNVLWNREIINNKHTTSIINEVESHINRDHEVLPFEKTINLKISDDKSSTEEENQIRKGLDYLHQSNVKSLVQSQNILNSIQRIIKNPNITREFISGKMFESKTLQTKHPYIYIHSTKNTHQHFQVIKSTKWPNKAIKKSVNLQVKGNKNVGHLDKGILYNKVLPNSVVKEEKHSANLEKLYDNKEMLMLKKLLRRNKQGASNNVDQAMTHRETLPSASQRKLLQFSKEEDNVQDRLKEFLMNYARKQSGPKYEDSTILQEINVTKPRSSLTEEVLFDSMWKKIKDFITPVATTKRPFSMFIYGRGHQCLLGRKVSLLYPHCSVVTVVPLNQQHVFKQHRKFVNLNSEHNHMLLKSDLTLNLVHDIHRMPELFKFQILGLDVFRPILSVGKAFLYYLGELITLAETTFLEIPTSDQLVFVQQLFVQQLIKTDNTSIAELIEGLIAKALKLVGAEMETPKIYRSVYGPALVVIKMKSIQRKVNTACGNSFSDVFLTLLPDGITCLSMQKNKSCSSRAMKGIGLELLIRIGLPPEERMHLFRKYLDLTVHQDMCPRHIIWIMQRLMYLPADKQLYEVPSSKLRNETMQMLLNQIESQIGDSTFSFMEYNSKESVGLHLAPSFPNSSFVALSEDTDVGQDMYNVAIKKNLSNFVSCVLSVDTTFTTKLLKSPDILRYQLVDYNEFLHVLQLFPRAGFNLYLGQILSTGLSTFIQVPSSKILSLASSTFYPDVVLAEPSSLQVYAADSHPLPVFHNAEAKLLYESAKADVEIKLAQEVLPEQYTDDGSLLPWRLVRCNIRRLKTLVDHHFDYELDGHMRKYFQHVVSENKSQYEVHLIRKNDGFRIPYGQVNAISLIALLRMGLLPVIKERFYGEFLSLPLYEDMAPWNIVFRGGRLEYIDYDTKDVTFNKIAPAAYQIMAMLMNYKRTVSDFGHCNDPADNLYGIELISHCVGSDFKGPCQNTLYPVPCADNTCKATYIDCLKSLQLLEQQYNKRSYLSYPLNRQQTVTKWEFNQHGRRPKYRK